MVDEVAKSSDAGCREYDWFKYCLKSDSLNAVEMKQNIAQYLIFLILSMLGEIV